VEQGERGRPPLSLRRWLWLLPAAAAVWLAPRWWQLVTHPVVVPATPAAAAREELPRLRARVQAEPRSPQARLELVAALTLIGDRLGAWQQLAIAESLGGPLDTVRQARARTAELLGEGSDAAAAAGRWWRASPSDLRRAAEYHRLLTLQAEFDRALAVGLEAMATHPTDPTALAMAGESYFNLARYPEAIRLLQRARTAAPDRLPVAMPLGVALLRADRGREAVTVLNEVAHAPSPPAQAWEFLGQAQLSVGSTTQARGSFERAEAAGAPGGGAAFGAALVALAEGETVTAERFLNRALARDAEHSAAAVTLAQLLRSQGRRAEAAAVQARAALAVEDAAEAVRYAREAARLGAQDAETWRLLSRVEQSARNGPAALAALRRSRALAPEDAGIARQQIETALAAFSPQEALRACQAYAALQPAAAAELHWWRFRAYRQTQESVRASLELKEAAATRPEQPEFLIWQGRVLLKDAPTAEQTDRAESYLRRALVQRPRDAEIRVALAEIAVREQRWEEAGEQLRQALALNREAGPGPLWLQLARVDRALGRTLEARWDVARYREAKAQQVELARRRADAAAQPLDGRRKVQWVQSALGADRPREARAAARAAIRLSPADPAAYRALSAACQRLGRLEDRIVAMEAAQGVPATP
jgi:Flp pilus assembly protein TadD